MNRRSLIVLLVVFIILATSLFFARSLRPKTPAIPTLVIASSLPFVLPDSINIKQGAELAFEKEAPLIQGVHLIFDVRDDSGTHTWDEGRLKSDLRSFISDPRVIAFFGTAHSTAAKVALPILNRAAIPTISPTNSLPSLTKPGFAAGEPSAFQPTGVRNYVRTIVTDDTDAYNTANWMKDLRVKSVSIADDLSLDFSSLLSYQRSFTNFDIASVGRFVVSTDTANIVVANMIKSHPDAIYYQGFDPHVFTSFIHALRKSGYKGLIMAADSLLENIDTAALKEELEGVHLTSTTIPITQLTNARAKAFEKAYIARYHTPPAVSSIEAYEAMRVLLTAISRSDKTREGVMRELLTTHGFPSIIGDITFDEQGDNTGGFVARSIYRNGQQTEYTIIAARNLDH